MSSLRNFVWSIADQLRGVYKPHQFGGIVLPFTILRRLDCILEPSRDTVRDLAKKYESDELDAKVGRKTGLRFYTPASTTSPRFRDVLRQVSTMSCNITISVGGGT